jgi:methylated-DNA-[protein]-cysteine S-methyltransferase
MSSNTPIGKIGVAASNHGLVAVEFVEDEGELFHILSQRYGWKMDNVHSTRETGFENEIVQNACKQIEEYLAGEREGFDVPIDWSIMTPFQVDALQATYNIAFGQVATYQQIAQQIGRPRAARAVGRAEATNPMPLVIPCHRVVGTDGGLHGYGGRGGLKTKAWLLKLEGAREFWR